MNKITVIIFQALLIISSQELVSQNVKLINDQFVSDFENSLDYNTVVIKYSPSILYRFEKNPHYENKIDTVIILKVKGNVISYYKAFGKIMLTDVKITTQDIDIISPTIKIGTKKIIFLKRFNLNELGGVLTISDTEERIKCSFLFIEDVLVEIKYEALIQ